MIDKLHAEVQRIAAMPEVRERLSTLGAEPSAMSPAEFGNWLKAEIPAMAKIVKDERITVEWGGRKWLPLWLGGMAMDRPQLVIGDWCRRWAALGCKRTTTNWHQGQEPTLSSHSRNSTKVS